MTRRRAFIGLVIAVLVLVALNIAGVLRYPGGPLREGSADAPLWLDMRPPGQGTNRVGFTQGSGVTVDMPMYTSIGLHNESPWTASIVNVRLVDPKPGIRLVEVRLALPGTSGPTAGGLSGDGPEIADLRLDTDYVPLPARLEAHNAVEDGRLSIEVVADAPELTGYEAVAIDYQLGPFTFSVIHHAALSACIVPIPEGTTCSLDSAD